MHAGATAHCVGWQPELREVTGRWVEMFRTAHACERCGAAELDKTSHMVLRCTALANGNLRHAHLLSLRGPHLCSAIYISSRPRAGPAGGCGGLT